MSFTYYVTKIEDLCGKLKNDGSMIDYVYGPEPSKIWWRNLWTAPYPTPTSPDFKIKRKGWVSKTIVFHF